MPCICGTLEIQPNLSPSAAYDGCFFSFFKFNIFTGI